MSLTSPPLYPVVPKLIVSLTLPVYYDELGVTAGSGLNLFGISSMRQNASVCGFAYQGAGKPDFSHSFSSKWYVKNAHVAGVGGLHFQGHDERLVVRHQYFSLFVRLDVLHPFSCSGNQ